MKRDALDADERHVPLAAAGTGGHRPGTAQHLVKAAPVPAPRRAAGLRCALQLQNCRVLGVQRNQREGLDQSQRHQRPAAAGAWHHGMTQMHLKRPAGARRRRTAWREGAKKCGEEDGHHNFECSHGRMD